MNRDRVSSVTGRRQSFLLHWIGRASFFLAVGTALSGGQILLPGVAAICLLVAAPILRVIWLVFRWMNESDWRFALFGSVLFFTFVAGAAISAVI